MSASPAILESTADHAFARYRDAFLYVWRRHTTIEAVQSLLKLNLGGAGDPARLLFGFVQEGAEAPPKDVQRLMGDVLRAANGIVASALTFEGTGFRAAMVRFVAMSLVMIGRPPYPHRIFASASAGATFLRSELAKTGQVDLTVEELVEAMDTLRAAKPI